MSLGRRSSISAVPQFDVEHLAHPAATAMQQDSLVAGADTEDVARFRTRQPFDVAQDHNGALTRRKLFQGSFEDWRPQCGFEAVITLLRPLLQWIGPLSLCVKPSR